MKTVEELETALNNVEAILEETRKDLEELKKSKNNFEPTPKGWTPNEGEVFWIANLDLRPSFIENNTITDEEIIRYNRVFQTKEECQLYCDIQRAFKDASKPFSVDEYNYCICYNNYQNQIKIMAYGNNEQQILYFESRKTIQNLIDKFGEENVKRYYLGVY